jgi:hypothetical protein
MKPINPFFVTVRALVATGAVAAPHVTQKAKAESAPPPR